MLQLPTDNIQFGALMGQAEQLRVLSTKVATDMVGANFRPLPHSIDHAQGHLVSTEPNREETMSEKQIFEIPQQLRELAEKNVEQARTAYGQFMDAMAQAVSAWSAASSDTVTSGFKAVQERAIQFAKENAEAGFALANELTKAKELQDVLRLQSSFAQKQMESYARQAQVLGQLMAEAARSAKA